MFSRIRGNLETYLGTGTWETFERIRDMVDNLVELQDKGRLVELGDESQQLVDILNSILKGIEYINKNENKG